MDVGFYLDLVPVSSTVIPLPIYQVSYGINVAPQKGVAIEKPLGPVTLVTGENFFKSNITFFTSVLSVILI